MAAVLEQLVQARSVSNHGGHFRVEQEGDVFHVVPTEIRDRHGNWAAQGSILDAPISLPMQDRDESQMFDAICGAVSAAAQIKVNIGIGIGGGFKDEAGYPQYRLGADSEPARRVLMRALAAITINEKLTWLLFYSAENNWYTLNILPVRGRSRPR